MLTSLTLFIVAYIFARELSSYNELHTFRSCIVLKSKIASVLLVGRFYAKKRPDKHKKGDEMKMTLVGIIFYIFLATAIVASPLILFVIPKHPYETSLEILSYSRIKPVDTLNEYAVENLSMGMFLLGAGLCSIHTYQNVNYLRSSPKKDIMTIIFSVIALICSAIAFFRTFDCISSM